MDIVTERKRNNYFVYTKFIFMKLIKLIETGCVKITCFDAVMFDKYCKVNLFNSTIKSLGALNIFSQINAKNVSINAKYISF